MTKPKQVSNGDEMLIATVVTESVAPTLTVEDSVAKTIDEPQPQKIERTEVNGIKMVIEDY